MVTWPLRISLTLALCAGASSRATPPPADVDPCGNPQTQAEMNACASRRFAAADAALNAAYKRLMSAVPAETRQPLRDAQRAWLDYRDKHCACAAALATGGTMYPLFRSECREKVTRARTEDLVAMEADATSR